MNMIKIASMLNDAYAALNESEHLITAHAKEHERTMRYAPDEIKIEDEKIRAHVLSIAFDRPGEDLPIVFRNNKRYYKDEMRAFVLIVTDDDARYAIKKCDCYEDVDGTNDDNDIIENIRYEYTTLDMLNDGVWFISDV